MVVIILRDDDALENVLLCCKNEVPKKLLPAGPGRPRVVTLFGSFSSSLTLAEVLWAVATVK